MNAAVQAVRSAVVVALLGLLCLVAAMLVVGTLPAAAQSDPQCGPWPDLAAALQTRYGEEMLFEGAPAPGRSGVIIMARPDGTTWSALSLSPDGRTACLRAAGASWRMGPPPQPGEEG